MSFFSDWKKVREWQRRVRPVREGMPEQQVLSELGEPGLRCKSALAGEQAGPQECWYYACCDTLDFHAYFSDGNYAFGVWVRHRPGSPQSWRRIFLQSMENQDKQA